MTKPLSLNAQIAEVEYELAMRAKVYPGLVRSGRLRQSEADLHVARLTAVLRTLHWLFEHEAEIKARRAKGAA
jgi:hypothetical protein